MRFHFPLCLFNRHRPISDRVDWDGANYVGQCRFCGTRIRRMSRGKWLRDRITG